MTKDDIKRICKKYNITNYKINDDMTIDVNDDVIFEQYSLKKIPVAFGEVRGSFRCSNLCLTTLENCPIYVGNNFYCYDNKLSSFEHCPKIIGNSFNCSYNPLSTFDYYPEKIGENLNIYNFTPIRRMSSYILNSVGGGVYSSILWKF